MDYSHQRPQSYYSLLGVHPQSSISEIRTAYRKLAMRWHPDRWSRTPSMAEEAKRRFQQIQEAYAVLSDPSKKTLYDAGLYDPDEEVDKGFSDFVQEMLSLMSQVKREEKNYSIGDLRQMLMEMAQGFERSTWSDYDGSRNFKRARKGQDGANSASHYYHVSNGQQFQVSEFNFVWQ